MQFLFIRQRILSVLRLSLRMQVLSKVQAVAWAFSVFVIFTFNGGFGHSLSEMDMGRVHPLVRLGQDFSSFNGSVWNFGSSPVVWVCSPMFPSFELIYSGETDFFA